MITCERMAQPATEPCVQKCEMVDPDEFLSLATSRMALERTQSPGDGLLGLMDVVSGRRVAVESQRLQRHRLRRA